MNVENLDPPIVRQEAVNGNLPLDVDDIPEPYWQMVHSSVRNGSGFNYTGPTASYAVQPLFTVQGDDRGFPSFTNGNGSY